MIWFHSISISNPGIGKPPEYEDSSVSSSISIDCVILDKSSLMNGTLGLVYIGQLDLTPANPDKNLEYKELMKWADEIRKLKIRTNAESPDIGILMVK